MFVEYYFASSKNHYEEFEPNEWPRRNLRWMNGQGELTIDWTLLLYLGEEAELAGRQPMEKTAEYAITKWINVENKLLKTLSFNFCEKKILSSKVYLKYLSYVYVLK